MSHLVPSADVALSPGEQAGANAISRLTLHSGGDADHGKILCVLEWGVHGLPM